MDKATKTKISLPSTMQQCIDRLGRGELSVHALQDSPAGELARHETPDRDGYPLRGHAYPELLVGLNGRARLRVKGKAIRPGTGQCHLLLPGFAHGETYADSRSSYHLLWVSFTPGGANFFISSFSPRDGFRILPERFSTSNDHAGKLWTLATESDRAGEAGFAEYCQGLLLCLVSESLDELARATSPGDYSHRIVEQVRRYILAHHIQPIHVRDLAAMAGCSENHLNTRFREAVGQPIRQYIIDLRLQRARRLLLQGELPIKNVALQSGFNDPLYFSRLFRDRSGCSPSDFRQSPLQPSARPCTSTKAPEPS